MDRSPAFENFMNKMATMQGQGKPKMSATSMKIGSGGLESRVANNEKKITILKNIFKVQRQEIGEKITPKVSNLEQSLLETTNILGEITQKLQLDYSQRLEEQKNLFDQQRKDNLDKKRDDKEEKLETVKKSKISKKLASVISKPFGNIFDKLLNLAGILGGGILGTNFLKRLNNPEFLKRIEGIFNWTTENWKAIAIGAGVIGTILAAGAIANFISGASLVFGILTNPIFLAVVGVIAASYLFKKSSEAKKELTREGLTGFAEENNLEVNEKLIDLTSEFQLTDIPQIRSGDNVSPFSGFNPTIFSQPSFGNRMLDYFALTNIIPNLFRNNNEEEQIIPNANLVQLVRDKDELRKLFVEKGGETFIELPDIDLTDVPINKIGGLSGDAATSVPKISSVNFGNSYMTETPELFGFASVIYD
tara:strand:+ start:1529 stop:2791 length:1263 start_codon:yes stop_codon:yes gene_type:complete